MINEAANTFDRFRLSTINMIGWCIFLTRFYLFTWVTLIINSTVLNFYFCTRCSDWLILKNESKTIDSVGWRLNFSVRKTFPQRNFLSRKFFFFLITCLHFIYLRFTSSSTHPLREKLRQAFYYQINWWPLI